MYVLYLYTWPNYVVQDETDMLTNKHIGKKPINVTFALIFSSMRERKKPKKIRFKLFLESSGMLIGSQ